MNWFSHWDDWPAKLDELDKEKISSLVIENLELVEITTEEINKLFED